jgi:hypothetical protein
MPERRNDGQNSSKHVRPPCQKAESSCREYRVGGKVLSFLLRSLDRVFTEGISIVRELFCLVALTAAAQNTEYTIKVMPPGGPAPRLADGHPDLSGLWLPNAAGQGITGRYGVDPEARRVFDPNVTPEEPP